MFKLSSQAVLEFTFLSRLHYDELLMQNSYIESNISVQDPAFEVPLRRQSLVDFVGQQQIRERLDVVVSAAKQRKEALGHCLFSGPPGLGKTTLAHILAKSMGTNLVVTSGPVIKKPEI